MSCIKDFLEIIYYIAFVVFTWLLVKYTYKTYKLESNRHYSLLCQVVQQEAFVDYEFSAILEIYNEGNQIAKNVNVVIENGNPIYIDFIKAEGSFYIPLGTMVQTMVGVRPLESGNVSLKKGNPLNVSITVDEKRTDYEINTDWLFVEKNNCGSLRGIEEKLDLIARNTDWEKQRLIHGNSLVKYN